MPSRSAFDRIADLPDDGARQKEVYARFGLASYHAQLFEEGMVNLIAVSSAVLNRTGQPITQAEIDMLFQDLHTHTAGRLIKRLEGLIDAEGHLALCQHAAGERNRLIHRFFREHAQDFMTAPGMQRMVDDSDNAVALFERADLASTALVGALLALVGVDETHIDAEFERLVDDAHSRDAKEDGDG